MGKKRIIAETGAGQHGVAAAAVCAMLGLECVVYMGEEDIRRQSLNVFRMKLLGAEVSPVTSGSRTLKDAINEAIRDWVTNVGDTYYLLGSVVGPHPYPLMVRDFQSVIGKEARQQSWRPTAACPTTWSPASAAAATPWASSTPSSTIGVKLIGVEAAGEGLATGQHAALPGRGQLGVLHGAKSYILQDERRADPGDPQHLRRLDYPGVGPEHSYLKDSGRADYVAVTDEEALEGFQLLCRTEGIIPALESSHAVFYAARIARELARDQLIVVNLSGRGDKDMDTVAAAMGVNYEAP